MKPNECTKWQKCSASMCPLRDRAELSILRGYLAGDDEICALKSMATHPLVRIMRRIERAGATGLFTLAMLEEIQRAGRGIVGLHLHEAYASNRDRKARDWIKARVKSRTSEKTPC